MTAAAEAPQSRSLRPIVGVWSAMIVALIGTRVSAVALPWFVLVTTGSAAQTGFAAFCEMAPYVVVKALSGPIVDRIGPRTVSMTMDVVSACAAAAVVAAHSAGALHPAVLYALIALIGAARGPGDLGKHVMIPEAADRAGMPLERATGVGGVVERLASTIGPGAGGALVATMGAMAGLAVNAAAFALGSVIVAVFAPRRSTAPAQPSASGAASAAGAVGAVGAEADPDDGYWRRFAAGFRWLRGEPLVFAIVCLVGVTNFLDAAKMAVLVPVWARADGGGPAAIGILGTVSGIAAVCGSLVATALAPRLPRRAVFIGGFLLAGPPPLLVLASGAPLWAVGCVMAVSGLGAGFLNPVIGATSYERIPRSMLGRVGAIGDSLAWAGIPLGGMAAGAAVGVIGLSPVLLVAGGVYLAVVLVPLFRPEWRDMDRGRGKNRSPAPRAPAVERPVDQEA